ncbi:MAG: hypothetical protein VYD19_05775, partial [Myxococcota bacterium]|nr:hypothetical protein [Myxococcota bacterium]
MSLKAPLSTPMIVALWLTLPLASPQRQLWAAPAAEAGLSSRAQQRLRNAERLWDQRRFAEASQLYLNLYEDEQIGDHLLRAAQGQASAGQKIKAFRLYQRFVEEHPNHRGYGAAEARLEALRGELRGSFQKVRIESDPAGADVYIDRRGGGTFGE